MALVHVERSAEAASYGGLVDALGGITTVILAIIGLAGVNTGLIVPIAVIVFGAALLVEGGTMLSEHASLIFPEGAASRPLEQFAGGNLSALFLVGAAGIVLGILALLNIASQALTAVAIIAYGGALVLSSDSVRQLYLLRRTAGPTTSGGELIAGEMAAGSGTVQVLAGLTAIVLGVLAVAGTNPHELVLAALIVIGSTMILTGSTLSSMVISFMRPLSPKL